MIVKRDKRNVGKKVAAIHPSSLFFNRIGTVVGFRGDQSRGNPYVMVSFNGVVETISSRWLEYRNSTTGEDR